MRFLKVIFLPVLILAGGHSLQAQFGPDDMAQNLEEALGFNRYPTYGQYLEIMQGFAGNYPDICRLDTIGTSMEGRLILALKISDHVDRDEPEPAFLYTSTMHGNELPGYPLMLRLADTLLESYGSDPWISMLVDSLEIWINPLANPDGAYHTGNHTLAGAIRENSGGLDLNRCFPDIKAGESDDTTGRPVENRHMMNFLQQRGFHLSANIHSGEEVVNYPWDWKGALHPDDDWFRLIAMEYADEAHAVDPTYMAGFEDGITNGYEWYEVQGSRQDYVTYFLEGREVTLELSYDFLLEADFLEEYWQRNRLPLLYYMTQATYGIHGTVRSSLDGTPVRARIEVLNHDDATSTVSSDSIHGDFYRYLAAGIYDLVFTADGYESHTANDVVAGDYSTTFLDVTLRPLSKSILQVTGLPAMEIYPNPAGRFIRVDPGLAPGKDFSLYIFSAHGGQLETASDYISTGSFIEIPLGDLESGLYLLQIRSDNASRCKPFVKY